MALNKTIIVKLKEKTKSKPELQAFIVALVQFESEAERGWYEKTYSSLLDEHCKEDEA